MVGIIKHLPIKSFLEEKIKDKFAYMIWFRSIKFTFNILEESVFVSFELGS